MKEEYKPSEEEINKAEDMMTDKEKEMSEERGDTYRAGEKHKEHEMYTEMLEADFSFKKEMTESAHEIGLSKEIEDLFVNGEFSQMDSPRIDKLFPSTKVTEGQIIKAIEELPKLNIYGFCSNPSGFTKPVMKKLLEKFPDIKFCCPQGMDARLKRDMLEVCKEVGASPERAKFFQD